MLLCPAGCQRYFVASEEDPDATLSDIVDHLTEAHACTSKEAMRLLAKLELMQP